jgi:hypothetical protein
VIRGVDDSVSEPSNSKVEKAKGAMSGFALDLFDPNAPLIKFAVKRDIFDDVDNADRDNDPEADVTYYIGSKPSFKITASPTGRSTRTFAVYALDTGQVVFLKDTWRIDLGGIQKEGHVYTFLHKHGVSNIAPLIRSADVPGDYQRTWTQKFAGRFVRKQGSPELRPHQHYRLVLGIVANKLTSFKSSWVLVNAMKDALRGKVPISLLDVPISCHHPVAYEEAFAAGIMHRDISVGNIMITDEDGGLLIDWDLCKRVGDKVAHQSERTVRSLVYIFFSF